MVKAPVGRAYGRHFSEASTLVQDWSTGMHSAKVVRFT